MQFDDIVGNVLVKQELKNLADSTKVPHALLFVGPKGSAKLACALAFINYINCESEIKPCGKCTQCIKSSKNIHPDIHFSFPVFGANQTSNDFLELWRQFIDQSIYADINAWMSLIGADNKQANINKAECLNIIRKLSLKAFQAKYKCILLWLPEYLGREGNRLLKLLEEPPENTIIILVAEESEKILNTILSRCQLVKFKAFADNELAQFLENKYNLDHEKALNFAYVASGDMNEATKIVEDDTSENANKLLEWLRICFIKDPVKLMDWINEMTKIGRERQKQFIKYALHFFTELYHGILIPQYQFKLSGPEKETAKKLLKILDESKIASIVAIMNGCYEAITRNANPKILFMADSLQINKILMGVNAKNAGLKK